MTIIYLNGPSSSGKTSLAKRLQDSFSEPFLHVGIDKIIGFMPEQCNDWTGGSASDGFSWGRSVDPTGHPVYEILQGPFALRISQTFRDITLLLADQKYNLIIDDVAFGFMQVEEWKKILKDYSVLYVGVTAPLEVIEQRERSRGDRMIGGARGQYFKVHENVAYDLELDTHKQTPEENIEKIKAALVKKHG